MKRHATFDFCLYELCANLFFERSPPTRDSCYLHVSPRARAICETYLEIQLAVMGPPTIITAVQSNDFSELLARKWSTIIFYHGQGRSIGDGLAG